MMFCPATLLCQCGWQISMQGLCSHGFLSLDASGDLERFPPVIQVLGTGYPFSSRTVLAHRKVRRFGVPVSLHLIEGAAIYQYSSNLFADEPQDTFIEMTIFFNEPLSE